MENRYGSGPAQADEMVQISVHAPAAAEILRGENGQFLPGQSPNPGGRPRKTEEERDALEEIRKLAPGVAEHMTKKLNNPKVPAIAKVRILEIILERTYGKPETAMRLTWISRKRFTSRKARLTDRLPE